MPLLPQIVDTHILSSFFFYFAVMLVSFVSLILIFNFFELMGDMVRNSNLRTMLTYLFFHDAIIEIYQMTPICVLVGVLLARRAEQTERDHRLQSLRSKSVSPGRAPACGEHGLSFGPIRLRLLLRPRRQPPTGSAPRRDQGPPQIELAPLPTCQVDQRRRLAHLLLPLLRRPRENDGGHQRFRSGPATFPPP